MAGIIYTRNIPLETSHNQTTLVSSAILHFILLLFDDS